MPNFFVCLLKKIIYKINLMEGKKLLYLIGDSLTSGYIDGINQRLLIFSTSNVCLFA